MRMRFTETLGADDIPKRRDRKHQCNGLSAQKKKIPKSDAHFCFSRHSATAISLIKAPFYQRCCNSALKMFSVCSSTLMASPSLLGVIYHDTPLMLVSPAQCKGFINTVAPILPILKNKNFSNSERVLFILMHAYQIKI